MGYAYQKTTDRSIEAVIDAIRETAASCGFDVVQHYDIRATIAAKGFRIRPIHIIEIAPKPGEADELIALLLPLRLNAFEEGGRVVVSALLPTLVRELFPDHDLEQAAQKLEDLVVGIVDGVTAETT